MYSTCKNIEALQILFTEKNSLMMFPFSPVIYLHLKNEFENSHEGGVRGIVQCSGRSTG